MLSHVVSGSFFLHVRFHWVCTFFVVALALPIGRHRFASVSGRVPTLVGRKVLLLLLAQFWLGARSSPDAVWEGHGCRKWMHEKQYK